LPNEALPELQRLGKRRIIRKGQALVWEGDDAPLIVNVLDGMLKLSSSARNGSEQILGLIGPGGFAGRPQGGATPQTISALVDTEICIFASDRLAHFADAHPEIRAGLLDHSLDEMDRMRRWMLLLARGSAMERVAALLLDFGGEGAGPHPLPLSRGQMAEFLGLTIETVSRQFTRLKTAGIIGLANRDSFELKDRGGLLMLAGVVPEQGLH
jgi:CRP/FNR family transcriptional regulator